MNRVAGLLRLEARDFENLTRWRWVLIDEADGAEVAAHKVRLNTTDWQFEAFHDLHQHLTWHVAPDRRGVDDTRIVAEVGEWIGTQVLGPIASELASRARRRHVTVRVVVPARATELLLAPLELAHVGGRLLAVQDVTLVMQPGPDAEAGEPAPRERLRVLGLFSLFEGGQPLNLRRERQSLVTLIRDIAKAGKAADVRVLQYGVTHDLLRDLLAEGESWGIIHISGHGAPGELLLETADGRPDRVTAPQLANLLMATRERVRLITVAACWSAAESVADQAAATDLREFGTADTPLATVADLCRQVSDIPGTDLPGLLAKLSPDPATAEQTFGALIARAKNSGRLPPWVAGDDAAKPGRQAGGARAVPVARSPQHQRE